MRAIEAITVFGLVLGLAGAVSVPVSAKVQSSPEISGSQIYSGPDVTAGSRPSYSTYYQPVRYHPYQPVRYHPGLRLRHSRRSFFGRPFLGRAFGPGFHRFRRF